MKKLIFFALLLGCLSISFDLSAQETPKDTTINNRDSDLDGLPFDTAIEPCYRVSWDLKDFNGHINQACPPGTFYVVLSVNDPFYCKIIPVSGYPKARLFFAGNLVDEVPINDGETFVLQGNYSDLNLDQYLAPQDYTFEIKVFDILGIPYFSKTRDITLIPEGQIIEVEESNGVSTIAEICEVDQVDIIVCNDDTFEQTLKFRKVTTSLEETTVSAGFEVSVGGTVAQVFDLEGSLAANQTYALKNTATISSEITMTFSPPDEEICIFPGLSIKGRSFVNNTYKVTCKGYEFVSSTPSRTDILAVNPTICETPWQNECTNPNPVITSQTSGGNLIGRNQTECIGDIFVNLDAMVPAEELFTFFWTGPNGFVSFEQNLTGVPFGAYQLTILDGCGNTYLYDTFLCDAPSYGAWTTDNILTGPYCRTVSCGDEASDCTSEQDTECVFPEFTDWELEILNPITQRCIRQVFLNGEPTSFFDEKDPEITEDYDADQDQCIRYFICRDDDNNIDDEASIEDEPTEYGDWDYDGNVCFREVICFGKANNDFDYNEAEPQITWFEYDEGFNECIGYVYCDEDDDTDDDSDAETTTETFAEIEWDDSIKDATCVGTVFCGDDQYELDDPVEMEAEVVEAAYNEDDNWCEVIYSCDGEEFMAIESIETEPADQEGYCYIICGGERVTDDPVWCDDALQNPNGEVTTRSLKGDSDGIIMVTPNPFQAEFSLSSLPTETHMVMVFNGQGQLIQRLNIEGQHALTVSTEDWQAGIYFLSVMDAKQGLIDHQKIVKMP